MTCQCGFTNNAGARFCGSCGTALEGQPGASAPSSTTRPVRRRPTRITMVLSAAALLVVGLPYWWMTRPEGPYITDNGGLYPIQVDGKYGFMDRSGRTVIAPQFDFTLGFSEGLAAVRIGDKWGYIDDSGAVAVTPQFDDVRDFRGGRAVVKLCCGPWYDSPGVNRFGIIDADGKYVAAPDFPWLGETFGGGFVPARLRDGSTVFLDRSGKVAITGDFTQVYAGFSEGLTPAAKGGPWGYIDTKGKWVIEPQFEWADIFSDGLAGVRVAQRTGYVDRRGKFVVNPQFESNVVTFAEGRARVWTGGKLGFIDRSGTLVVPAKFDFVLDFRDGLAPVQTGGLWGYIDRDGRTVIEPRFDSASVFQNGLAQVAALGKEAYITTSGSFVVDPFPGTTIEQERARRAEEARKAQAAEEAARQAAAAAEARRIAELPSRIVGTWKWQTQTTTYRADGTINVVLDRGGTELNRWSVSGETLVITPVESNGRRVTFARERRFKIVAVTDEAFTLTDPDNGRTLIGTRIGS